MKKIAIIVRNNSDKLRDIGDINGKALQNQLINLGVSVKLVYLNSDKADTNNEISYFKGLFENFDIIYASSPKRFDALWCIIFSILHLKPLFISIFDFTLAPITQNPLGKPLFKILNKIGLVHIFAVSEYQKKLLVNTLNIRTEILLPCLLTFGYNKLYSKPATPVITFAGSTNNQKRGIDTLLLAANLLIKTYPKLQVRILNKFSQNERWSEIAPDLIKELDLSKNVVNIGFVKSMSDEYKKSWAYVLPFNKTLYIPPLPFTMIEAMSFSVPVISTKIDAFKELLPTDSLIETGDYHALAEKLSSIIKHKTTIKVQDKFFPENVAKEFLKLTQPDN